MQIAIDGPASSGKSTISKLLASDLHYVYCDTGAMYRVATLLAIEHNLSNEADVVKLLEESDVKFFINENTGQQQTLLNGNDVSKKIRDDAVSNHVSDIAKMPKVRKFLTKIQQQIAHGNDVVMDGRDIGTNVLPNAELKIFLTASIDVRVERRVKENQQKGLNSNVEDIKNNLIERDRIDSTRKVSPLKRADDAIDIDTSNLTIDEVVKEIKNILKNL